jgi:hypothetical protein
VRVAVTTPLRPSAVEEAEARQAALRHGLPYAPRGKRPLETVRRDAGAEAMLVLSRTACLLALDGGEHRWSAGMAALRVKWLRHQEAGRPVPDTRRDPFLEACGLEKGDRVLDATLGLGADALVAAEAVGPAGRVVGLEAAPALAAWVAEGLRRDRDPAARRVEVVTADHAEFLSAQPDGSFDVVVFDPMFRTTRPAPGGFDVVRRLADARPLAPSTLARARRVARRWVVVKDGAPGWDLARLGLVPLHSARGAHRYYARVSASPARSGEP